MAEVCYNQSEFDYRREEGVNQSSLKKILESPAHYQAALKSRASRWPPKKGRPGRLKLAARRY